MAKLEVRSSGLYKNGSRWWVRSVRGPLSGTIAARSTGTDDLKLANRVAAMLDSLSEQRLQWDVLELAALGEIPLQTLYNHYSAGSISELRTKRAAAQVSDPDLSPFVDDWHSKHLLALVVGDKLRQHSADEYKRQVRALIPDGEVFVRSQFTEDVLKERLSSLVDPNRGLPLSGSTRRRYLAAWQLFYRWARKRVPLTVNPFEERDWFPANNSARSTYWDFDTAMTALDRMTGEPRLFMAMVFGSGLELGAGMSQLGRHFRSDAEERAIIAPGSKNEHREDRTVFLTKWAYTEIAPHAKLVLPTARLWSFNPKNRGREVRDAFYEAQVAAKLIEAPPVSKETGKKLWSVVNPHRIHDARHSYCYIRMLGLDGEPRYSTKECSLQLGHADEQMVMKVYNKANIAQRLKLIELAGARQAGRAAAAAETR